jgi:carbamoyltransferase
MAEEERPGRIAELLQAGKVVGVFQGKMEFGPRALGNRSILASPADRSINDWLNQRLERSEFMPFAPSALAEFGDSLFYHYAKGASTARFMTVTYKVREEWVDRIPAVVHVDQTCRPQMVHRHENRRYYDILQAYYQLTGLPLLLNTSFNVHEEPIICRPEEAIRALREKRIDVLVLEDFLVQAHE